MPLFKILLLLFSSTFLCTFTHAQAPANRPLLNSVRSKFFFENARAIDSLLFMNERTFADKRNAPVNLAGTKLIRKESKTQPVIRKQPSANEPFLTKTQDAAYRSNAICYTISGRNFLKQDSLVLYTNDPCMTADGNVILAGEFASYTPYLA